MTNQKNQRCEGQAVGIIVKNTSGHYLVLYRLREPRGLAFPAGHFDDALESPHDAVKRELFEETGIRAVHVECLFAGQIKSRCRRGGRSHYWHVYLAVNFRGKPRRREKKQHAFVKFMSPKRIREYVEKNDVDPAWVEIFRKLKIINGHNGKH